MILITGGLGFIGSHIALRALAQGKEVILVDNLVNSNLHVLERLQYVSGQYIPFAQIDVRNTPALNKFIEQYPIDVVIHCAGFKSLQESELKPIEYYNNNLSALMSLIRVMQRIGTRTLLHLSSLAVYGHSASDLAESTPFNYQSTNPYIRSQQMMEQILFDVSNSDHEWNIVNLRLGNVAGAYERGILGEYIPKLPKSILGLAMQAANREREVIELFSQADTEDGTVERSFVHVLDVCDAVDKSLQWQQEHSHLYTAFNICQNKRTSIAELIKQVERVTATEIETIEQIGVFQPLSQIGASVELAQQHLNWSANRTIDQIVQDQWLYYHGP
ncbi:MAG: SDR family NAD(P)-dependent oxidoreductase [Acinetobacter sp.]